MLHKQPVKEIHTHAHTQFSFQSHKNVSTLVIKIEVCDRMV